MSVVMTPAFHPTSRILSAGWAQRFRHHIASAADAADCRTILRTAPADLTLLPFGAGESLGDSCLNDGGGLILTSRMAQVSRFQRPASLRCLALPHTVQEIGRCCPWRQLVRAAAGKKAETSAHPGCLGSGCRRGPSISYRPNAEA